MNYVKLTDAAGGATYVNLSNIFTMRRISVEGGKSFTRLFTSAVSTIATPEHLVDQLGPIFHQALYTDVVETPEAILTAVRNGVLN